MIIRKAKEKDLVDCQKILHTHELSSGGWYPNVKVLKDYLGKYFLVAEENNEILGCNIVEPSKHALTGWWFAVKKEARGRGIGSALMDVMEAQGKKDKKRIFLIYSKVKTKAIKFYLKRGYRKGSDFTELVKIL